MHDVNLEGIGFALLWTPEGIFPKTFCELLPLAVRPKPLCQICITKVSDSFSKCEVVKVIADIEKNSEDS